MNGTQGDEKQIRLVNIEAQPDEDDLRELDFCQ